MVRPFSSISDQENENPGRTGFRGCFCVLASDESLSAASSKAFAAIYGAILLRLERNLGRLSAFRANSVEHRTRTAGSTAGLARLTAGLAAGGLVLESFFGIEFLFTGSENELSATVFAYQRFVFVHGLVTPIMLIGDSFG